EEVAAVENACSTNPALATEVQRLQGTVNLLPYGLPESEQPPVTLRDRVLSQAQAQLATESATPSTSSITSPPPATSIPATSGPATTDSNVVPLQRGPQARKRRHLPWRGISEAIAAVLLIGLMVETYQQNQQLLVQNRQLRQTLSQLEQEQQLDQSVVVALQRPDTRSYSLTGIEAPTAPAPTTTDASGTLLVNLDTLEAVVALQGLPDLPDGQVYRLWAVRDDQFFYCGEFAAEPDGEVVTTLAAPAVYRTRPWIQQAVVTVESGPLSDAPTGPIVMATASS
ncbi:MAG: anti-sigma factor, partial [Cyanobacteria bacterium P01_H01_bin.121]